MIIFSKDKELFTNYFILLNKDYIEYSKADFIDKYSKNTGRVLY